MSTLKNIHISNIIQKEQDIYMYICIYSNNCRKNETMKLTESRKYMVMLRGKEEMM